MPTGAPEVTSTGEGPAGAQGVPGTGSDRQRGERFLPLPAGVGARREHPTPASGLDPAGRGGHLFGERQSAPQGRGPLAPLFPIARVPPGKEEPLLGAPGAPTTPIQGFVRPPQATAGGEPEFSPQVLEALDRRLVMAVDSVLSRRSRRRRPRWASSSDEDYSGGDGRERSLPRAVHASTHSGGAGPSQPPRRVIPEKIVPDDDTFSKVLDVETYALVNQDVTYNRAMAHGLGRLRKDVLATFGQKQERGGSPPLQVFEFLNRFVKACNDNSVSEGRALYLLPEFTRGELKRDLYSLLPRQSGAGMGRSVPTWNLSTGSSARMRTSPHSATKSLSSPLPPRGRTRMRRSSIITASAECPVWLPARARPYEGPLPAGGPLEDPERRPGT